MSRAGRTLFFLAAILCGGYTCERKFACILLKWGLPLPPHLSGLLFLTGCAYISSIRAICLLEPR
jgi:hypothetical protein